MNWREEQLRQKFNQYVQDVQRERTLVHDHDDNNARKLSNLLLNYEALRYLPIDPLVMVSVKAYRNKLYRSNRKKKEEQCVEDETKQGLLNLQEQVIDIENCTSFPGDSTATAAECTVLSTVIACAAAPRKTSENDWSDRSPLTTTEHNTANRIKLTEQQIQSLYNAFYVRPMPAMSVSPAMISVLDPNQTTLCASCVSKGPDSADVTTSIRANAPDGQDSANVTNLNMVKVTDVAALVNSVSATLPIRFCGMGQSIECDAPDGQDSANVTNLNMVKAPDVALNMVKAPDVAVLVSSVSATSPIPFCGIGKSIECDEALRNPPLGTQENPITVILEPSPIQERKGKRKHSQQGTEAAPLSKSVGKTMSSRTEQRQSILRILSRVHYNMVRTAMRRTEGPDTKVIATYKQDSIQWKNFRTLQPECKLSDEVIHYFLALLHKRDEELCREEAGKRRCHFFKSFFMTKLRNDRHTKKDGKYEYTNVETFSDRVSGKDIFALDKIFFPINISNSHWVLAVAFMQKKCIQYYDSLGGDGLGYLNDILLYFQHEHENKKHQQMIMLDKWTLIPCCRDTTPQQRNDYDCGVFTCMFAEFVAKGLSTDFEQKNMKHFRLRIAASILTNAIHG